VSVPPPGRRVSQPRWRSRITWGAGLLLVVGGLLVARLIAGPVALATSGYEDGVMRGGLHSGSLISPPPGRLITHRPLAGTGLRGHAFRITYHSRTVGNADIAVTGLVVLPFGAPPPGGWPIITYGHSTTGIADVCAPSAHLGWAPTDVWNALLDRRMAIAATDYEGLGGPGRHPYLVGTSEAHSMIDAVRAARQLSRGRIGTRYMALGHSQGGHAAVFTAVNARRSSKLARC